MKFLIQTIENKVVHDFAFTLIESIKYQNWLTKSKDAYYELSECNYKNDYIPIGSVEFVHSYLYEQFGITPKPINIPDELQSMYYTLRKVVNGTEKDIKEKSFVKSADKIKGFTEVCNEAPKGNYQISELIDIISEWRAFVFKGELVGLQNYSGDFTCFPNLFKIKEAIKEYKSQPLAFTLDFGILNETNHTCVIEAHNFYSCGLYGFANHNILPFMFSQSFHQIIKSAI